MIGQLVLTMSQRKFVMENVEHVILTRASMIWARARLR
jgi:hypothetical protein